MEGRWAGGRRSGEGTFKNKKGMARTSGNRGKNGAMNNTEETRWGVNGVTGDIDECKGERYTEQK